MNNAIVKVKLGHIGKEYSSVRIDGPFASEVMEDEHLYFALLNFGASVIVVDVEIGYAGNVLVENLIAKPAPCLTVGEQGDVNLEDPNRQIYLTVLDRLRREAVRFVGRREPA